MDVKTLTKSLEEVDAYTRGQLKLKVTSVTPPHVDVKRVRTQIGISQKEFADRFGLKVAAVRNWEQGLREPEGPTRTLLALIERNPRLIESEIEKMRATA